MQDSFVRHMDQLGQSALKVAPAASPGLAVILADWVNVINDVASAIFMICSIGYLLWKWRRAYKKELRKNDDK